MTKDALFLKYDEPIDRIAARLLWKSPDFCRLSEPTRNDLMLEPPRVKPEDIVDIFSPPPSRGYGNQSPIDRRGTWCGAYLVLGYNCDTYSYKGRTKMEFNGGRRTRIFNVRRMSNAIHFRGHHTKPDIIHRWWVREPDGSISSIKWEHLRKLKKGQTMREMLDERKSRKQ